MNKTCKLALVGLAALHLCTAAPIIACDDTLIMLLTAQNPGSEFSRVIRSFSTDLTALGIALKAKEKASFDAEMAKVMESWLEFSKKYMTSPPEEARNDLRWASKTSETARSIGEIRRLVNEKKFIEAHDRVLELNSKMGAFFEAFGVSDEKQLFISASTNLTTLERALLGDDREASANMVKELTSNLASFAPLLEGHTDNRTADASKLLLELAGDIEQNQELKAFDGKLQQLRTIFEELRSQVLMREWFPGLKN
ncbi:MAG: hypothetical protein CVV41_15305 [Candidatus Riflebacteria bacterium HGW-Riflebacteria-1]|jgi:hypothetical protein|nr:MAG: hypothetical protein CVV41_15305 [Candidatus Riflebacteria bacterium HGW-Riflebacteria-1]